MMSDVQHVHHYVIPPPDGPTVQGTCKNCGQVRSFDSAGPDEIHVYRRYPKRRKETILEAYGFHEEG